MSTQKFESLAGSHVRSAGIQFVGGASATLVSFAIAMMVIGFIVWVLGYQRMRQGGRF